MEPPSTELKYCFRLPIGDWSGDGHGKCEWFSINSNLPLKEIHALYAKTTKRLAVRLDGSGNPDEVPFANYEECYTTEGMIKKLGLTLKELDREVCYDDIVEDWDAKDVADLFVRFMVRHNPELKLELQPPHRDVFGFGAKPHIGYIGYGLFE